MTDKKDDKKKSDPLDSTKDLEDVRRSMCPAYKAAAEGVEYWKAREERALKRRNESGNIFTWLFWQLKYLSAVGNGAETERCRDGLLDPTWGIITQSMDTKMKYEARLRAIERYNNRNKNKDKSKPDPKL